MWHKRKTGVSIIYITLAMVVLVGFASLAVDLGRVQLARAELRAAADAAARYGASAIGSTNSTIRTLAKNAAADNMAAGSSVVLTNNDIEIGRWNSSTQSFTSGGTPANAVRVTAGLTSQRGSAVPLFFAKLLGKSTLDITAQSTATYTSAVSVDLDVPAYANPWLAGMPSGTLANPNPPPSGSRRDRAGAYTANGVYHPTGESPAQLTGLNLTAGAALTFDTIAGVGQNGPTQLSVGPDGNLNWILSNDNGAEHGKSNLISPISAVIGVFLDNNVPGGTPPPTLDFTTASSRDFTTLQPQLRQMFFIGDGKTSGGTVQNFIVPQGATRLFIGKMDGFEWNNNSGVSTVTIERPGASTLVK